MVEGAIQPKKSKLYVSSQALVIQPPRSEARGPSGALQPSAGTPPALVMAVMDVLLPPSDPSPRFSSPPKTRDAVESDQSYLYPVNSHVLGLQWLHVGY